MPQPPMPPGPPSPWPVYGTPIEPSPPQGLAGRWKALSGKVKVGVVAGAALSLAAVGAVANPLTQGPAPHVPTFASASVSLARTSAASSLSAIRSTQAETVPSSPPASVPTSQAPTQAATTPAPAPAKTSAAAKITTKTTTTKATTTAPKTTAPAVQATVTPGAYCSKAGATGVTSTGKPMVCTTSSTDPRLRWRAA